MKNIDWKALRISTIIMSILGAIILLVEKDFSLWKWAIYSLAHPVSTILILTIDSKLKKK